MTSAGIGVGVAFTHNGSSGGTDIVAAMVSKHTNVSVGRTMLYTDFFIISSSYFIFHKLDLVVYGFIVLALTSYTADMIINTNRQAVQFTIFSKKWQEIATAINNEAKRGCTVLYRNGLVFKARSKGAVGDVPQNRICHYFPNYKVNRQGRPHIAGAGQRRLRQRLRRTETEDAPPGPDRHTSCPPRGLVENRMIATPT